MPQRADTIPVKYTEDLAQYAEVRPVITQPMALAELVGLVLTSTGKQPDRIRTILRKGSCTYNIYRYWWPGFELDPATLAQVLARFPDPDPARPFHPARCLWAQAFDTLEPKPRTVLIEREDAARRRWFRRQNFWGFLMALAARKPPAYRDYSYYHRADLYRRELSGDERELLLAETTRLAPRELARRLFRSSEWAALELACHR